MKIKKNIILLLIYLIITSNVFCSYKEVLEYYNKPEIQEEINKKKDSITKLIKFDSELGYFKENYDKKLIPIIKFKENYYAIRENLAINGKTLINKVIFTLKDILHDGSSIEKYNITTNHYGIFLKQDIKDFILDEKEEIKILNMNMKPIRKKNELNLNDFICYNKLYSSEELTDLLKEFKVSPEEFKAFSKKFKVSPEELKDFLKKFKVSPEEFTALIKESNLSSMALPEELKDFLNKFEVSQEESKTEEESNKNIIAIKNKNNQSIYLNTDREKIEKWIKEEFKPIHYEEILNNFNKTKKFFRDPLESQNEPQRELESIQLEHEKSRKKLQLHVVLSESDKDSANAKYLQNIRDKDLADAKSLQNMKDAENYLKKKQSKQVIYKDSFFGWLKRLRDGNFKSRDSENETNINNHSENNNLKKTIQDNDNKTYSSGISGWWKRLMDGNFISRD